LKASKNVVALVHEFEGCKLVAYWDKTGRVWTIGYGHTRDVYEGMTCSQAQADVWLLEDLAAAVLAVNKLLTRPVTQVQFDALVDFAYNCGGGNLAGSTLLKLVNAGDFTAAALEFPKWNKSGGVVLPGLTRRRLAEQKLFQMIFQNDLTK
jgi:lysozyme